MREILFPLTGTFLDDSALPHTIEMARLIGARVHLVRVLENRRASDRPIDPVDWHVKKLEAETTLERAAARFRQAGVSVEAVLLEGHPVEHVVNYARRAGAELIVLAGGTGRGTIGALGAELLWRSYLTTLLVRPQAPEESDRLTEGTSAGRAPYGRGSGLHARPVDEQAFGVQTLSAALARIRVRSWVPGGQGGDASGSLALATRAELGGGSAPAPGATALQAGPAPAPWRAGPLAAPYAGPATPPLAAVPAPPASTAAGVPTTGFAAPAAGAAATEHALQEAGDGERRERVRYRRILTALDGSKRAECVLSWVRRLSEEHEAEVILAHVVVEPELPRLTPPSGEDVELARRLVERNREEAAAYLSDARARLGVEAETRLLQGRKVAAALHDLVEHEQVDMVVLSAHGYGGESRWPFGDVSTSFIGYGTTPLLLVQDMPRSAAKTTDVTAEQWGG